MSASVWKGAALLTIAAVIVKVMSAAYRIPYQNIAGDLGFYVYQQIYPFFAIAVFLAAYGFPAAVSKLVAARLAEGDREGAASVMIRSLIVLSSFSIILFFVLFGGASWISQAMGDENLSSPIKMVAFSFLFIPPISVIRGFFQGYGMMKPTAISQVLEQFTRASLIIIFTLIVTAKGLGAYAAGIAAGGGSLAGMGVSSVLLVIMAVKHRGLWKRRSSKVTFSSLAKVMGLEGAAFSISSLTLVFFLLIDTFTVIPLLGGQTVQTKVLMGVYDRGYPLVQLATATAISFSLAFVPAMAHAKKQADHLFIQEKCGFAVRLSLAFGAAAVIGMALLAKACNIMLFADASGSGTLVWFGLTILFSMVAMTTAGILQALGFTRKVLIYTCIGLSSKLIFNYCLIPFFNTSGAASANVFSFAIIAVLNSWLLHRETEAFSFLGKIGIRLIVAIFFMGVTVVFWHYGTVTLLHSSNKRLVETIVALGGTASGGFIYLTTLIKFRYFSKDELTSLSKRENARQSA